MARGRGQGERAWGAHAACGCARGCAGLGGTCARLVGLAAVTGARVRGLWRWMCVMVGVRGVCLVGDAFVFVLV